jgi:hypothetical protein
VQLGATADSIDDAEAADALLDEALALLAPCWRPDATPGSPCRPASPCGPAPTFLA